jgi:probable phosphoglycerate mutase
MIVSLIRHGSTRWNEERRIQGQRDVPLSPAGRTEVRRWRVPVEPALTARWISSPLARATETAAILSGAPAPEEAALIEMDWGDWEGRVIDELRDDDAAEFARREARGLDFRPPSGESPRDVLSRLQPWLLHVADGPSPVIAVTHLGVLRVVLAAATGWDMTGKPPIRLQRDALHRFSVDSRGQVAVVACNVPLRPGPDPPAP